MKLSKERSEKRRKKSDIHLSPSEQNSSEAIVVRGARANNLRNVSVRIPRDRLVVITGPSGSGKSSLAFDTIYAEGQRRYIESLSTYARQFVDQLTQPDVDSIEGLSPTLSIVQRTISTNPRSTVGTVTEIYDYLRLLFARVSEPLCWNCGDPIRSQSPQQIVDQITALPEGMRLSILAPVVRGRKGEHQKELQNLIAKGFVRARIDGQIHELAEDIHLDRARKHDIEVVVDRVVLKKDHSIVATRISDAVDIALKLGEGSLLVQEGDSGSITFMSERYACTRCNINYPEAEPRTFSFNSPLGACPKCDGIGSISSERVAQAPTESELVDDISYDLHIEEPVCTECNGSRLRKESLSFKIAGASIAELCQLQVSELLPVVNTWSFSDRKMLVAGRVLQEIRDRLGFLNEVGAGYLTLNRAAKTLSGGEAQRIRLASQIGSSLVGVIYVLDEPSIGLHPRDHDRLLKALVRLRDAGNSILVVEHDRETIEKADWILDFGPGAGARGGEIVAEGSLDALKENPNSLTGKYLTGEKSIPIPLKRRAPDHERTIKLTGCSENNLKMIDVEIPIGLITCVTGVSGSGKSSLIIDTLYRALLKELHGVDTGTIALKQISGLNHIDKVIDINQAPIGRTPRSNPATYTGVLSMIRDLFAQLPEAQIRGYKPGRFSFNVAGGRCETCQGGAMRKIEMHFLPDVYVKCEICAGKRFNTETLSVKYRGLSIADVLNLTVEEGLAFFSQVSSIRNKLQVMVDVGLGYLQLGQSATTLSGGEAQRIKLARELSRRATGRTLYILDEPTTGLHFEDILNLINMLQTLRDQGNTVVVIEHNLDVVKVADHLIDIGPEGGAAGGLLIASGTPEMIARTPQSHTGLFLAPYLDL